MKIAIKGIYHERTEDAPFIGALVCATSCNFNCLGCINEPLKYSASYYMYDYDIIKEIKTNPFNQGIVLGGLEWSLQIEEMKQLVNLAIKKQLQVMIYTGLDEYDFLKICPNIKNIKCYVKYGRYLEKLSVNDYRNYGVKLASSNQKIIKYGE